MIKANPKWKYAGTYVDDGFSGTNTEHRPAFRLMIANLLTGVCPMNAVGIDVSKGKSMVVVSDNFAVSDLLTFVDINLKSSCIK